MTKWIGGLLCTATLALAPALTGQGYKVPGMFKPALGKQDTPETSAEHEYKWPFKPERPPGDLPPTLEVRVGEASEKYQTSGVELERVTKELLDDLNLHQEVPDLKSMKEVERLVKFERFLTLLEEVGRKSTEHGDAFDRQFKVMHDDAKEAARYYWEAEKHFSNRERSSKFPETKAQFRLIADFFAARAMRCDAQSRLVIPTDLQTERERVRELVESVKELRDWVRNDRNFLRDPVDMENMLAQFTKGYKHLGSILGVWSKTLTKGLTEKDLPASPVAAPTTDAGTRPRPAKKASSGDERGSPRPSSLR